jgi:hypothetical protein
MNTSRTAEASPAPAPTSFGSECAAPEICRPARVDDCAADMIGPAVRCDADLHAGETILVRFGREQARFVVAWVGRPGTPHEGHVGIKGLGLRQYTWDVTVKQNRRGSQNKRNEPELLLMRVAAGR